MATSSLPSTGYIQLISDQAALTLPVDRDTIDRLIDFDASYYSVSPDLMRGIIKRESNYNQYAVGKLGEIGLVQILPKAHPDISVAEMQSPIFSIDFLAKQLAKGNGHIWSTYKAALASLGP